MTTIINNEHKKLNVPNLRFPEFQGEWEKCKLEDVMNFSTPESEIQALLTGNYRKPIIDGTVSQEKGTAS